MEEEENFSCLIYDERKKNLWGKKGKKHFLLIFKEDVFSPSLIPASMPGRSHGIDVSVCVCVCVCVPMCKSPPPEEAWTLRYPLDTLDL